MSSAATHAVLPKLATRGGPTAPGRRRHALAPAPLRRHPGLLAAGVRLRRRARGTPRRAGDRLHLPRPERPRARDARRSLRSACREARSPSRSIGRRCGWSGRTAAIRPTRPTSSTTGSRPNGIRLWSIGGGPTTRRRRREARQRARAPASSPRSGIASSATAPRRGRRGLCVFAIDTELLGHWWAEGPIWLREVLRRGGAGGGAAADPAPGAARSTRRWSGRSREGSWGEGKTPRDLGLARRLPTSPGPHAAWSCRCCGRCRCAAGREAAAASRARVARRPVERLGVHGPPRPGRRLPLPAGDRARGGSAAGHRLRRGSRAEHAQSRPRPEPGAAAGALIDLDDPTACSSSPGSIRR